MLSESQIKMQKILQENSYLLAAYNVISTPLPEISKSYKPNES
jgi:hypothetical protein